jgi:hypothetical protein
MTVSTTQNRVSYAGNGVTSAFSFPYVFFDNADLVVLNVKADGTYTKAVLGTDYTVAGAGVDAGGTVTMTTVPTVGTTLVIYRDPAMTQPQAFVDNDPLPAKSISRGYDRQTVIAQRIRELADRSFRLSDADTSGASPVLPSPTPNAFIGWNDVGNGLVNRSITDLITISAYGTAVADKFVGDGTTKDFTLSANPGALANLDVSISGITQEAGRDFTWDGASKLSFVSAPPSPTTPGDTNIYARYLRALPQGYADASIVNWKDNAGVARDVQSTLQRLTGDWVSAKDPRFGAKGDGVADDTTAIRAALATGRNVFLPRGTYKITSGLDIDVFTQCMEGDGALIDARTVTDYAGRIVSTAVTLQDRALQSFNKVALKGISWLGTNVAGRLGLVIGNTGSQYVNSNDIVVERCGFYGFEKQIVFADNAWRTKFVNCGLEGGGYPIYYQSPSNAGEVIEFDHGWIVDWTIGPVIVNGNFLFNGTSLIGGATTPITANGNAKLDFIGCNLEDQANSSNYWLALNGVAHARFFGGQFLVNSTRTKPLVYMAPGAMLSLDGVSLSLYGANLQYEVNSSPKIRSIVEGLGKHVTATGCNLIAGTTNDFTIQAVLGGSNALFNGDFELGATQGWAFSTYGPTTPPNTSTATADAASAKDGAYGAHITAIANCGAQLTQDIDVSGMVGRVFCIGMWAKAISGTGTLAFPTLQFISHNNAVVQTPFSFAVTDANTTFFWRAYTGYIPDGAKTARVILDAQQLVGGCQVAYDNVVFQVI